MMRVLLITDNHNPHGGGAEKYFFSLKDKLKELNYDVYSLGFGPKNEEGKDYKVIKECDNLVSRHFWRMFFNPVIYCKIRKYIKKVNPDVIHIHNVNKYTQSLLLALRGYPVVQTVHDYGLVCPTLWNIHNDLKPCPTGMRVNCMFKHKRDYNLLIYLTMVYVFYIKRYLLKKMVDVFITPSPQLKNYLEKNNFSNVVFIPNFITITNDEPHFQKINYNQILYIGQLEENKGVHVLIKSLKKVVEKKPDVILNIAGSGTQQPYLEELVKRLNLEKNVRFLGWVNNVSELIQESAFVVVPSIWLESFGMVILESMIYFRPVIGSNRGGISYLIEHGKTGLLFDITKPDELVNSILCLLEDNELIKEYGKNAHQKVINISKMGDVKNIVDKYKEAINKNMG